MNEWREGQNLKGHKYWRLHVHVYGSIYFILEIRENPSPCSDDNFILQHWLYFDSGLVKPHVELQNASAARHADRAPTLDAAKMASLDNARKTVERMASALKESCP
jgi:hypothetical protein